MTYLRLQTFLTESQAQVHRALFQATPSRAVVNARHRGDTGKVYFRRSLVTFRKGKRSANRIPQIQTSDSAWIFPERAHSCFLALVAGVRREEPTKKRTKTQERLEALLIEDEVFKAFATHRRVAFSALLVAPFVKPGEAVE